VLGPDDYKFSERLTPASCFKNRSFRHEDLYHAGCSTRSIKPPTVPILQVTSVIVQVSLFPSALNLIISSITVHIGNFDCDIPGYHDSEQGP